VINKRSEAYQVVVLLLGRISMLKIPLLFAYVQHPQRTLLRRFRKVKLFLTVCIFLLANGLTTAYVDAQLQNGLVGYWSFDEGTGTEASDSSRNGNTANLVNGPSWIASGAIAGALSFDGVDDYVSFPSQAQSTISISAWVYAHLTPGNVFPRIIDMPGYVLFLAEPGAPSSNSQSLGFISKRSAQDGEWDTPANTMVYNSWNHVAVVYDSSSISNNADLYINGVKQTISKIALPQGTQTANEGEGIIGNRIPLNRGWDGLIDELRIYNRALSAAEIVSLYDQGNNPPFNFSLSNSMSLSATQGASATNTITASLTSGFAQPVSFSASGLPSGASASFSQKTCSPTCSSLLTIETAASTPPGSYTITVTGTGGEVTKPTTVSLTVSSQAITPTVAAPTITPNSGSFTGSVSVTLQTATSWASIFYTTNGSTPTQSSTLYTGAFTLTSSATVNAIAFQSGANPSPQASANFTIVAPSAQLTLTWQDNSNDEDDFAIERRTGTNGAYSQIASVAANVTSYMDNGVTPGGTYCYRVQAINSTGASAYTNEACKAVPQLTSVNAG
jgi:hypothetical protein